MDIAAIKKARNGRAVGVVVIGLGLFVGVMLFMIMGQSQKRHAMAMTWPEVEARVSKSKVTPKKKLNRVGRGAALMTEYVHEWTASYEVNGRKYKRESSWTYSAESEAKKNMRKYQIGKPIRLHYNPKRPNDTQIHRESSTSPIVGAGFGAFLVMVGVLQFAWYSHKLGRLTAAPDDARTDPHDFDDDDDYDYYDDEDDNDDVGQPKDVEMPACAPGMELESAKYFQASSRSGRASLLLAGALLSLTLASCARLGRTTARSSIPRLPTEQQATLDLDAPGEQGSGPIRQTAAFEPAADVGTPPAPVDGKITLALLEQWALENHPAVNQANAIVDKSRGIYDQVGALPNPVVGYSAAEIGVDGTAGQQGGFISQTIVRGDKLCWNQTVAGHDVQAFSWEWEVRKVRVQTDVRIQFYETLAAQKRVELAKGLLEIADNGVAKTTELLEKGEIGTRPDVLQAEIQRNQVKTMLEAAKVEADYAWKKLAALVGRPGLSGANLEGELFQAGGFPDWDTAYRRLVESSPQLQAAMARVHRAEAEIQRQAVQTTPNLLTQVGVARDSGTGDGIVNLQIGLPLPIFNRNRGNISIAEAEHNRAAYELQRLQMQIQVRLTEAFSRLKKSEKQAELYRTSILPKARENLKLIEEGYNKQQFNFLRMLTARRLYTSINFEYIDYLVEMRKAQALIDGMLLSGGLDDAALIRGIFTHLTAVTVLAHALLGCCWHHAHEGECCAGANDSETPDVPETTAQPPMCACGQHQATAAKTATRPEDCGSDGEDFPQPVPSQPCSHGRCSYLSADDVRVREGGDSSIPAVDQQLQIAEIVRPERCLPRQAQKESGGIGGRTARICYQLWVPGLLDRVKATIALFKPAEEEPEKEAASGGENSIELSPQALRNIGVPPEKIRPIERGEHIQYLTVPAIVAERPGVNRVQVSSHLTGVIGGVFVVPGQTVKSGDRLFRIRLTHEDLVKAQTSFLETVGEMKVVLEDIKRLENLSKGLVPAKLRERTYEKQKLDQLLKAKFAGLRLHGLSTPQIVKIRDKGELVREVDVHVPFLHADGSLHDDSEESHEESETQGAKKLVSGKYVVHDLMVYRGRSVKAGDALVALADFSRLDIRGQAFEQDEHLLQNALRNHLTVQADFENGLSLGPKTKLRIRYIENEVEKDSRALHFFIGLPNEPVEPETSRAGGKDFLTWRFRPGQRLRVRVPVKIFSNRFVLPVDAVARDGAEYYRLIVIAFSVFLIGFGAWETSQLGIDVFPNLNRPRVVIMTEAHGLSPEEVEALVTFPIETGINGASGVVAVRSSSGVGVSVVYVDFEWGTDIYVARQIINERLQLVTERLPKGVQPQLAPISSIMGQIVMIGMWSYENEKTKFGEIDADAESELASEQIPASLRRLIDAQPLEINGGALSAEATVRVDQPGIRWLVQDAVNDRLYAVRANKEGNRLDVHQLTSELGLRTLADWAVRQRLLTIGGVSQVFTMGGGRKQYQVLIDPDRMLKYGVTLQQIRQSVEEANENATGGYLDERGPNEWLVRSLGRIRSADELRKIVVTIRDRQPVTLNDVATVTEGAQVKRGDSAAYVKVVRRGDRTNKEDDSPENKRALFSGGPAVVLTVNKQPGADTRRVTQEIINALEELELPPDIQVQPELYSQRSFIDRAIANVVEALRDGGILVVVILFLFLLNFRTTFITLTAIPLSIMVTALVFTAFGLSINTMTLGGLAVAIGELVDDAIVDVENIFRRLRENREKENPKNPLLVVYQASVEIRNSIVFGTLIVVLVFIPLFALSGMEGRLFAPLGVAYIVSILSSLLVSLTVTPVLSYWLLSQRNIWPWIVAALAVTAAVLGVVWLLPDAPFWQQGLAGLFAAPLLWGIVMFLDRGAESDVEGRFLRALKWVAGEVIALSLKFRTVVLSLVVLAVLIAALTVSMVERDFLPPFNEGSVQLNVVLMPGTSLRKSNEIAATVDRRLMEIPDVVGFVRRTGRAELDEHAEGVNTSEIVIDIDPESTRSREEVLAEIRAAMKDIPGIVTSVEQPIAHLISHMLSGVKAQVGIKLYGDDLNTLRLKAQEMKAQIQDVPGVTDLLVEKQVEIPQLQIRLDWDQLKFYGLTPGYVNDYVKTAMNGIIVSSVLIEEKQQTFDLLIRMDEKHRESRDSIERLSIDLPGGGTVPLKTVAKIVEYSGPNTINRENVRRRIVLQCNVADRGLVDVVNDIKSRLDNVELPQGYFLEYGGQFESQQKAARVIGVLFVVSMLGVFLVLYTMFHSANFSLQVMAALPMALIGSVAALVITGQTLTVAAMVGFISLGGIASRNGILLLNHYLHLVKYEGETWSKEMIIRAGQERLAPVLMTALTSGIGLVPLAMAAGEPGKEILYPVATVIIGGLLSSTLLEFIVRPALFWTIGRGEGGRLIADYQSEVPLLTETEERAAEQSKPPTGTAKDTTMKRMTRQHRILAMLLVCAVAAGCGKTDKTGSAKTGKTGKTGVAGDNGGGGHPTKGPNGGQIIEFEGGGGHDYHGEVVHDDDKETVTIYILDASGKKHAPVDAKTLTVNFKAHGKAYQAKLKAMPVKDDSDGMSSRFVTGDDHDSEELVEHFDDKGLNAEVVITIGDTPYRGKIPAGTGGMHDDHKTHKTHKTAKTAKTAKTKKD
eukprot:g21959.t1